MKSFFAALTAIIVIIYRQNKLLFLHRESCVQESIIKPRAQRAIFPDNSLNMSVIVRLIIQSIFADKQHFTLSLCRTVKCQCIKANKSKKHA